MEKIQFSPEFEELLKNGEKTMTTRSSKKKGILEVFIGERKIGFLEIEIAEKIKIYNSFFTISDYSTYDDKNLGNFNNEVFAKKEGCKSWQEFIAFPSIKKQIEKKGYFEGFRHTFRFFENLPEGVKK